MLEILQAENKALKAEIAQLKATPPETAAPAEPETTPIEIDAPPAVVEPTAQDVESDSDIEHLPAKRRAVEQSPPLQGTTARAGNFKRNIREDMIIDKITRVIDLKFERGNLQQFLQNKNSEAPDIIALQETRGQAKLSGYGSFCADVSGAG
ncbi:hypothetical protein HPB47_001828 [Ixodes persulcatus]|uniref:Uncharacterized protein n=1 Tax=Ixodes persulcatus TaxID=34615 RepID=A0AC60PP56_IXOPE|nr:hypothetical protein HPB47_001828 [Ixodes persulcatus]